MNRAKVWEKYNNAKCARLKKRLATFVATKNERLLTMNLKRKILTNCALAAALLLVVACSQKQPKQTADHGKAERIIVLYYSQTGHTKLVAEAFQKVLGVDMERIEASVPYDGDYQQTIDRCRREIEQDIPPAIKPLSIDLADYHVIFLGYPIWFSTYPRPIKALIDSTELAGKKIVPFYTFGSGRPETSESDLRKALPDAEIVSGYGVHNARLSAVTHEIDRFLKLRGFIEGGVEPVEDYSNQAHMTDEERTILETACSGYLFPKGMEVSVGSRKTSTGTDYKYHVQGTKMNGEAINYMVYVTLDNAPGSKPEFTKVERE